MFYKLKITISSSLQNLIMRKLAHVWYLNEQDPMHKSTVHVSDQAFTDLQIMFCNKLLAVSHEHIQCNLSKTECVRLLLKLHFALDTISQARKPESFQTTSSPRLPSLLNAFLSKTFEETFKGKFLFSLFGLRQGNGYFFKALI